MTFLRFFKRLFIFFSLSLFYASLIFPKSNTTAIIANHLCCNLAQIPDEWIDAAKANLHIAYGHTSHGSQITDGMSGLANWKGQKYAWNNGGTDGALDIHDSPFSGAYDLGNPDRVAWATATRNYLNKSENSDVNVIMWSWCGQAGWASEENIDTYLSLMTQLETDFPEVQFVYMTGHLDGSGEEGNLHQRNEQIRNYCRNNGKILFDFADIESYDPDGNYYLDKYADDNCDYDSDGDGNHDRNWAEDWQNSHTEGVDWFSCSAAHSKPLNGNLKAYAAWWLWARLAGWEPVSVVSSIENSSPNQFQLFQNYPNPFNPETQIEFQIEKTSPVRISIFNIQGQFITSIVNEIKTPGTYSVKWNAIDQYGDKVANGIYWCRMETSGFSETIRMLLLR